VLVKVPFNIQAAKVGGLSFKLRKFVTKLAMFGVVNESNGS
jgi:hypothetical protein